MINNKTKNVDSKKTFKKTGSLSPKSPAAKTIHSTYTKNDDLDEWEMVQPSRVSIDVRSSEPIYPMRKNASMDEDLDGFYVIEDDNRSVGFPLNNDKRSLSLDYEIQQHHPLGLTSFVKKDLFNRSLYHTKANTAISPWREVDIPKNKVEASLKLKYLIRKGVPKTKVKELWLVLSGYYDAPESQNPVTHLYFDHLADVFHGKVPQKIKRFPLFGGTLSKGEHFLYRHTFAIVKRILCVIGTEHPRMKFMPIVPDMVCLFLYFLKEEETYFCMTSILTECVKTQKHMPYTALLWEVVILAFDNLIKTFLPKVWNHMTKKLNMTSSKPFSERWFFRLFVADLPIQSVFRIFSGFINEGMNVLHKTGLAILKTYKKPLLACNTEEEFITTVRQFSLQTVDVDRFMKLVWSFSVSSYVKKFNEKNHGKATLIVQASPRKMSLYYRPKILKPSEIANDSDWEYIYEWLPSRYKIKDPSLLFSTAQEGRSFANLYSTIGNAEPTIVFVKSAQGRVCSLIGNPNHDKSMRRIPQFHSSIHVIDLIFRHLAPLLIAHGEKRTKREVLE